MKTIARFFLFLAAVQLALGQPMIPVNNISPVGANSLIGNIGASGRAESIPLGAGLSFVGGALVAGAGGGVAPSDATYITQTPNATLPNEQALSLLNTGIMFVTTGTGAITSLTMSGDATFASNGALTLASTAVTPGTYGSATAVPTIIVDAKGRITSASNTTITATGNVTAAGTLDSGNIVIGQGTKAVATSPVLSISGSNATVTGNLSITGGTTFNNLTTANLIVSGNFTSTGVSDGKLLIGNTTGSKFDVATITAGDNILITNGPGSITINATGFGTGNVAGTGVAGQLAQWSGASNIVGIATANVTQGGTGAASLTANNIVTGNGTGPVTLIAPGTGGNVVTSNGTAFNSAAPTWFGSAIVSGCTTVTANSTGNITFATANANLTITTDNTTKTVTFNATSGGGGTPGGSNTQIQFNDGGAFGGDAGFVYDKTNDVTTLSPAGNGGHTINVPANKAASLSLQQNSVQKAFFGINGSGGDQYISGTSGDGVIWLSSGAKLLASTDGGVSVVFQLDSTSGLVASGTTTNNNAAAGKIGEYISSFVAPGSAVSLTNAGVHNITTIALTAGDWDLTGLITFNEGSATVTERLAGITGTSATISLDGTEGYNGYQTTTLTTKNTVTLSRQRASLSGSLTIYICAKATFSAGTVTASGFITARRVR